MRIGVRRFFRLARFWLRSWSRGRTPQPLRPLFEWLGRYPLLLVFPALPLAILWGQFKSFGLPRLYLAEDGQIALWAGFFTALLLAMVCFIGYLLDADEDWAIARRGSKPWGLSPSVSWYFFGTLTYPAMVLLLVIPALRAGRYPFAGGVFLASALPLPLLIFVADALRCWYLAERARWPRLREFLSLFARRYPTQVPVLHFLQLGFALLYVLGYAVTAYAASGGQSSWASPAVVICAVLGILAAVYGAVHFFFPILFPGALILVAAVLLLVVRVGSDEDVFTELVHGDAPAYDDSKLATAEQARLLSDQATLNAWLQRMREAPPPGPTGPLTEPSVHECPAGPRPRLVLVATSGGGIRAAAWTARTLEALDSHIEGFPRYVRLISGASGGMVSAGMWAAALDSSGQVVSSVGISQAMEADSLSPVALSMLVPFDEGRGRALEHAWGQHSGGVLDRKFEDLRPGEEQGWRPSLVYAPMIVEDGRRLLVSNLDLSSLVSVKARALASSPSDQDADLSVSGLQLFRLFPGRQPQLSVATAARMSASFPYVSPASQLPTLPSVRVVDAGYYDNYGVDLLATWIHKHRQWLRECTSGVLLVQIRDHLENGWRTKVGLKSEPSRWARAMAGLTSPLEAVLKARNASMSFRNDELLGMLQQELNGGDACFFSTVAFELSEPAPLSWELSSEDTALMDGSTHSPEFQARLSAVKSWLKASPAELEHARQTQECPGAGAALPTADRTPE